MKKNKKIIVLLVTILGIVALIVVFLVATHNKKEVEKKQSEENVLDVKTGEEYEVNLKSTSENPIELEGLEAENIHIEAMGNQVATSATIINNSGESIEELDIEIELLDANGNTITTIFENRREKTEAGQSVEIVNFATVDTENKVANAKITRVEKLQPDRGATDDPNTI